ncbi:hypothetical protein FMEAI12_3130003 [Parafrankia sp. Ea1.12]|nr:hypothetical protein FMEAI12_3130003 [Parafrankia sp. Ea1.12]
MLAPHRLPYRLRCHIDATVTSTQLSPDAAVNVVVTPERPSHDAAGAAVEGMSGSPSCPRPRVPASRRG